MGSKKREVVVLDGKSEMDRLFDPRDLPKLSLEAKAAGDTAYAEKIRYFMENEKTLTRNILVLYWERGSFVSDMFRAPEKYGNTPIRKFAGDMKASPDQVRSWFRFFSTYPTAEAVTALTDKGIPWKKALILTTVRDSDKRKELEGKATEISSEQLQDEARKLSAGRKEKAKKEGKKVESRGGTKPRAVFKNLELAVAVFSRTLMRAMEALDELKELKSGDPDVFARANETREPADSAATELRSKLDKYLEASRGI